jgi:hypothetical protein
VAIDGAFFQGDASKASIKTRKRLERDLAAIDADIEAYAQVLEANDAREQSGNKGRTVMTGGLPRTRTANAASLWLLANAKVGRSRQFAKLRPRALISSVP